MNYRKSIAIFLILILISLIAVAHPGRTNSEGCHVCRTNCNKYALNNGEYHCHNKPKVEVITKIPPNKVNLTKNFTNQITKVASIIDGDTLKITINGTLETVRLLGINSPEIGKNGQCFGVESTLYMKQMASDKIVKLQIDSKQPNRDTFGRLLRYVYLENGTFINEEMVKNGYAVAYTKYNSDLLRYFISIEKKAKLKKLGLWSKCNISS